MAKFKELLEEINGLLGNNEIEALLGASDFALVMNHEIQDDTLTQIKDKLKKVVSIEDAKGLPELKNHFKKTLFPEIKGELLGVVDSELLKDAETLFGAEEKAKLQEMDFTKDRLKHFTKLVNEKLAQGGKDEELKKQLQAAHDRVEQMQKAHEQELKEKEEQMKSAISQAETKLLKGRFMSAAASYNWNDAYKDDAIKNVLIESKFNELTKVANVKLDDSGNIVLKDKNDPELDYHEGNKKIDFKTKLEESIKPFLVGTKQPDKKPQTYQSSPSQPNLSPAQLEMIERRKAAGII